MTNKDETVHIPVYFFDVNKKKYINWAAWLLSEMNYSPLNGVAASSSFHQEDVNGMLLLARAKRKYANKIKGDWRSQVEWAVAEVTR